MFSFIPPNIIQSENGFSVTVLAGGQNGIIYREENRVILVLSDMATWPTGYVIYKNSIKEWSWAESSNVIDSTTRDRIINSLLEAFSFQGYEARVDGVTEFSEDQL